MSNHPEILIKASALAFDGAQSKSEPGACCNHDCLEGRACPLRTVGKDAHKAQAGSGLEIGLACTVEIALIGAGIMFSAYIFDAWEHMKVLFGY